MDREAKRLDKSGSSDTEPSFAELQHRISKIPDGPVGILDTPKPYRLLNVIGGVGAIVALLPMVLVKLMTPAMWMVTMVQIGMAVMVMKWLPYSVRSIGVMGWTLARWNPA